MKDVGPARHELGFAREAMGGTLLAGGPPLPSDAWFAGIASDSRAAGPGRMFFALPGEKVDGFAFCGDAVRAGAVAVVVAGGRGRPAGCEGVAVIAVADPRRAMGDLARAVRQRFKGRVIGVTGSNGKTTTRELIAAALSPAGAVHRTAGNFNTEVGLPVTVLEATGHEAFWVLEMAMRARGEIAALAAMGEPHVGLVTNVAAAHLGRLGSLDEIARAKGEIFSGLAKDGIAVLPADEPLLEREAAHLSDTRKRRFAGPRAENVKLRRADVRVLDYVASGVAGSLVRLVVGDVPVVARVPLAGEHNARNAAAALTVSLALGLPAVPAALGLAGVSLPPHRSRPESMGGRTVIDDCYNANPASMSAALRMLVGAAGGTARTFAVLGDMLELGDGAEDMHRTLGREAAAQGLAGVVALGPLGREIVAGARDAGVPRVMATDDPAEAAHTIAGWSRAGDWVLVKASRGMKLERVIEAFGREVGK